MKILYFYNLIFVFIYFNVVQSQNYELSFKVINETTGKALQDADISIQPCSCGGVTDVDGRFLIKLPKDTYTVTISYIGYKKYIRNVVLNEAISLKIQLQENKELLSEVVINAEKISNNLDSPQMGAIRIQAQDLKKLPSAIGEFDILRGLTLLAGVNNAGDVSNGVSVRGGSLDQNLILYDYAPVFNPTHMFGLFSVFTPDMISTVDLYRSNIPARYGGRTSSILDVKVKKPYVEKFKLSGGVGIVSSRLLLETPIVKNKLMLNVGTRAGFTGFLLPLVSERLKNTKANFYDTTFKLLYLPTKNDQLFFTGFYSKDFYQLDLISQIENVNAINNQYDFKTLNGTLKWIHTFKDGSSLKNIFVTSSYTPKNIFPERESDNKITYKSEINYQSFISEYTKKVNNLWNYYTGIQLNRYKINPGELDPGSGNSILPVTLKPETSYEFSAYANMHWDLIKNISLSGGLRFNKYLLVGPYTQAMFDNNSNVPTETRFFSKGKTVKKYNGLEPRLGVRVKLNKNTSLKFSYAKLNQYLQNVYNTTTPLPTSRWKTADTDIKPQISDSYGIGIYKNLTQDIILDLEGYYRNSKNNLAYKPGADFFLEEFLQRDVIQGKGKAYGVEFSLKKTKGKINGWFNYTWSRSFLRSQNENLADRINNNQWYPSDFDRPHVLNTTVNFESNKNSIISLNFTGQTGRPYTVPNGILILEDANVPIFIKRNNARLRTYHRLDFSWKIKNGKSKKNKRLKSDWVFTIYNVYARNNPINLFYGQRDNNSILSRNSPLSAYELSILNSPLISLTYNFVFE
ncbi:TonB-dependent receptor [Flavivirga spongiicola]|uniref:TonB-dependent receptor n=1 Tax=Flavivirga spongiicola TaxID=421621 RepID=A0ABU7XQC1_9FLAO|nr:TonB-dependent receptor [Flavivirga sp. MEBiC05379]MDO5977638.1 TonB-dependent receptor [Flavivirga sp. MEBiC05379]